MQDYFKSKLHEDRMAAEMRHQQARVLTTAQNDGALAAVSVSIAALSAHATALRALGLGRIVKEMLKRGR